MKKILARFKYKLMEFFYEYDSDRLLADVLVFFAVMLAYGFLLYFVLKNYWGL